MAIFSSRRFWRYFSSEQRLLRRILAFISAGHWNSGDGRGFTHSSGTTARTRVHQRRTLSGRFRRCTLRIEGGVSEVLTRDSERFKSLLPKIWKDYLRGGRWKRVSELEKLTVTTVPPITPLHGTDPLSSALNIPPSWPPSQKRDRKLATPARGGRDR